MISTIGFVIVFVISVSFNIRYIIQKRKRKKETRKFLTMVNNLCYRWGIRHCYSESAYNWFYDKLPDPLEVLNSNRPLELKEWFDQEDIDKIMN